MERLTTKTPKGAALKMDDAYANYDEARKDLMRRFRVAVERLAAYEESGLTPEETAKAFEVEYYLANLAANLRNRLKMYEDTGLTPEEIANLKSPCDLCVYGAPSAGDDKPCLVCPAYRKGAWENEAD